MSELAISYAALILADDGVDITVSLIIQNFYLESLECSLMLKSKDIISSF